nr:hypothetical protein Itr_chr04CG07030 [Ipomoea trifida]
MTSYIIGSLSILPREVPDTHCPSQVKCFPLHEFQKCEEIFSTGKKGFSLYVKCQYVT